MVEIEREGWAGRMQRLLRRANRLKRIERRYARQMAEALKYHESLPPLRSAKLGGRGRKNRRKGHNLALRLRVRRSSVLHFMSDFRVPFTNNQAEQDLRMMKLRMKISGGLRSNSQACLLVDRW